MTLDTTLEALGSVTAPGKFLKWFYMDTIFTHENIPNPVLSLVIWIKWGLSIGNGDWSSDYQNELFWKFVNMEVISLNLQPHKNCDGEPTKCGETTSWNLFICSNISQTKPSKVQNRITGLHKYVSFIYEMGK